MSTADFTGAVQMETRRVRVLFVCLGNICRSPTAQGVFTHFVKAAGLQDWIVIDSAGTGDYQIGAPPDARACNAAARRGYDLTALRARQVTRGDFSQFDYVLAMDEHNLRTLKGLCAAQHAHKVRLFTEFGSTGASAVPDPYGGDAQDFERVLDLVEDAAPRLLNHIRRQLNL